MKGDQHQQGLIVEEVPFNNLSQSQTNYGMNLR